MNRIVSEDTDALLNANPSFGKIRNKAVLVAGANSLIARTLTYFFLEANRRWDMGFSITVLVRDPDWGQKNYGEYMEKGEVRLINRDFAQPIEYDGKIDWLINSGGASSPYYYMSDPTGIIKANVAGTINLLDLCTQKHPEKIIYFSSREIYGRTDSGSETVGEERMGFFDHTQLRNCYPESKKIAENIHIAYNSQYNLPYSLLRLSSVYGPGMRLDNDRRFMADLVASILQRKDIEINSDGTAVRSYCYVTDAVDAIIKVLLWDEGNNVCNIANESEPHTIKEIADIAASVFSDRNISVKLKDGKKYSMGANGTGHNGYSSIPYEKLDVGRISHLGWSPGIDLRTGIKRTVESFEEGQR